MASLGRDELREKLTEAVDIARKTQAQFTVAVNKSEAVRDALRARVTDRLERERQARAYPLVVYSSTVPLPRRQRIVYAYDRITPWPRNNDNPGNVSDRPPARYAVVVQAPQSMIQYTTRPPNDPAYNLDDVRQYARQYRLDQRQLSEE